MSEYRLILLSGKRGAGKAVKVSPEDYDRVIKHRWWLDTNGYPWGRVDGVAIFLHVFVFGKAPDGFEIDHRERDKLDARRDQLRVVTKSVNAQNSLSRRNSFSVYKGVKLYKPKGYWAAHIQVDKQQISVGYYETEVEAARAYNGAALHFFGPEARLNEGVGEPIAYMPVGQRSRKKTRGSQSPYVGVYQGPGPNPWRAGLYVNKKMVSLGRFATQVEAAEAINAKCRELGIPERNVL